MQTSSHNLVIKIKKTSNPSKKFVLQKENVYSLGDFSLDFLGTISLKENYCINGYFGTINHRPRQFMTLGFLPATVDTTAALLPFQHWAKVSKQSWETNFRSSFSNHPKTFPFLKFWQNYLIDWAQKVKVSSDELQQRKKVNLIKILIEITSNFS